MKRIEVHGLVKDKVEMVITVNGSLDGVRILSKPELSEWLRVFIEQKVSLTEGCSFDLIWTLTGDQIDPTKKVNPINP